LAIIDTDGCRYIENDSGGVMGAPAGAMRRCAISPLGSGIAWWTRDQETAEVGRVVVTGWRQKSIGLVCYMAVLRSVYRSMSIRVGAVVVVGDERIGCCCQRIGRERGSDSGLDQTTESPAARLFSHLIVPRVRVLPPLPSSIFGQMPCINVLLQHLVDRG
jgi:hypothetical protein